MLRSVSYGGGVQSTALLVLAAQRVIDFPLFLFANVGPRAESPATFAYLEDVARPYAAAHGIELVELRKHVRGQPDDLYERLVNPDLGYNGIPWRSSREGPPMSRSCTVSFKLEPIARELKARGASDEAPATVALGISLDEAHRANTRKAKPHERLVYPLIGIGEETGLRLRRIDCEALIRDAGLPVPPKSSCWFCPHHSMGAWADLRRDDPDRFEEAAELEDTMRAKSEARGHGPVFISRAGIPLRQAVDADQPTLFDDADCDSAVCFT